MTKRLLHGSLYILCFLAVSFLSCKKSIDSSPAVPGDPFPIPATTPVNGNVSGRVIDENNAPVISAVIDCAGISTTTDVNGFFNISNATLDKYISTVTVTKPGYFKGYRSFSANAATNYVNIKLLPKTLAGTISSTSGGIITLPNTSAISFQQNSMVIKSTGAAYSGAVNVYASYIDPTSADIALTVPGSFMGRDASNLYVLQSTGMIAVELESDAGEPLQLATNLPATIKLSIPSSLRNKAPHTIDTWSLDDQGVWKKEGTAVNSGNHYEFLVTHFSFWNCDQPSNSIYLNIHMQDNIGNKLTNAFIRLSINNYNNIIGTATYGTTDNLGNVSGMVPAGFEILLEVTSANYLCIGNMYSQNIGPFNSNASLTVTATIVTQATDSLLIVSGTANDCTGQPLLHGNALIWSGQYFTNVDVTNGSYSGTLIHCDTVSSLNVIIRDYNSISQSIPVNVAVSGNLATVPLITLPCGTALNIYDGIYQVTGIFSDVSNATFAIQYPRQYYLITNGPSSVIVAQNINGEIAPGILFYNGSGGSFYGNFGLQASFDLTSNLMTEMHNYYGDPANPITGVGNPALGTGAPMYQASNGRSAALDPTGFNDYNPATRVIRAKYFMYQPSVVLTGPRCYFDETWTYIGPR